MSGQRMDVRAVTGKVQLEQPARRPKTNPALQPRSAKPGVGDATTCRIHGGSGLLSGSPNPWSVGDKT